MCRELLAEKRKELGDARYKLQNGLAKLDESRLQVCVYVCVCVCVCVCACVCASACFDKYLLLLLASVRIHDISCLIMARQVEVMSIELARKKEIVAAKAKDCDDLLVIIVSERRIADEQKSKVEADSLRIAKEEISCKEIADDAEADLAKALPALNNALEEVDKLDKSSIRCVRICYRCLFL